MEISNAERQAIVNRFNDGKITEDEMNKLLKAYKSFSFKRPKSQRKKKRQPRILYGMNTCK